MTRQSLVPILLPADPTVALEAATKQYVDTKLSQATADDLYVNVTGDTMQPLAAATVPLTIKGAAAQTANLVELQDSTAAVKARFTASGGLVVPSIAGNAGANNQLGVNLNWLPYSDGANYLQSSATYFRTAAGVGYGVINSTGLSISGATAQVSVASTAPTAATHLTRKDYVDGLAGKFTFVQEATPTTTVVGATWFRTSDAKVFTWYDSFWVEFGGVPA